MEIENREHTGLLYEPKLTLGSLACVIYTSGSTGKPKGNNKTVRFVFKSHVVKLFFINIWNSKESEELYNLEYFYTGYYQLFYICVSR